MKEYMGVYVLKLSNWSFQDTPTHKVEPPQPLGKPHGARVWLWAADWPAHQGCLLVCAQAC